VSEHEELLQSRAEDAADFYPCIVVARKEEGWVYTFPDLPGAQGVTNCPSPWDGFAQALCAAMEWAERPENRKKRVPPPTQAVTCIRGQALLWLRIGHLLRERMVNLRIVS